MALVNGNVMSIDDHQSECFCEKCPEFGLHPELPPSSSLRILLCFRQSRSLAAWQVAIERTSSGKNVAIINDLPDPFFP